MQAPTKRSSHPLLAVIEDRSWIEFARCRTKGDLFFEPFREQPPARKVRVAEAKRLCATCPAALECRDAGRRNHELGIWGGETEEERARAGFAMRAIVRHSVLDARRTPAEAAAAAAAAPIDDVRHWGTTTGEFVSDDVGIASGGGQVGPGGEAA